MARFLSSGEDKEKYDYSFGAIFRQSMSAGSLQNRVACYRQIAWNLNDSGERAYSVSINEALDSPIASAAFKDELRRQEARGGKLALDDFNRGCRRCDEMNAPEQGDESPEERDLRQELLPHFTSFSNAMKSSDIRVRMAAFDLWHMTFKGVCLKHKRPDLYDERRWAELRTIHTKEV